MGFLWNTFALVRFAVVMCLFAFKCLVSKLRIVIHGKTLPPSLKGSRKPTVAVIGGGIAGTSAAWALQESQHVDVTLFEERSVLGGNAKTMVWPECNNLRTGLSVLAWPDGYFRHYTEMLKRLEVQTQDVKPSFWIDADEDVQQTKWGKYSDGKKNYPCWAHGEKNAHWIENMERWDRMVEFVRQTNYTCARWAEGFIKVVNFIKFLLSPFFGTVQMNSATGRKEKKATAGALDGKPSFYTVTLLNPMNVIPLRWLSRRFGVEDSFWEMVVIPVYSSSFLTCCLDAIPAVIVVALDDIISVGKKEELKTLKTWQGSSKDVFDAFTQRLGTDRVILDAGVISVSVNPNSGVGRHVTFRNGAEARDFDYVVFACPSTEVDRLSKADPASYLRSSVFREIIPRIQYENQRDDSFTFGQIHSQRQFVMPRKVQDEYFGKKFSNYLKVRKNTNQGASIQRRAKCGADGQKGKLGAESLGRNLELQVENTFTLGTWVPQAVQKASTTSKPLVDGSFDCFVSYNPKNPIPDQYERGTVDNSWAHPVLSLRMMALARGVSLLQGKFNTYYCGSYTTPGNGHDLSLLSGFVVADALVQQLTGGTSGYYAFQDANDAALEEDFNQLRSLMGF